MIHDDATGMQDAKRAREPFRGERLGLLYQGVLIAIVRLQAGKTSLVDANGFQRRMEGVLDEIEREAIKVGYRNQDIRDAHYPVVAFLDEAVQRSNDPERKQWSSLQARLYSQAVAGEGVYDRLKAIRARRDSAELADLLEVYYLCFLLGYEGRYGIGGRSELDRLMDELRGQIERIRGPHGLLSPEGILPVVRKTAALPAASGEKWKLMAMGCGLVALIGWVVLKLVLNSYAQGVADLAP